MDRLLRQLASVSLSVLTAAAPLGHAWALAPTADADADAARAKELFDNGRRLFDEGGYDAAIVAFESAYRLDKNPNLLFNIHLTYERMGDFDKAIEYLDKYRALAPQSEQDELARARESLQIRKERSTTRGVSEVQPEPESREEEVPPPTAAPVEAAEERGPSDEVPPSPGPQKVFGPGPIIALSVAAVGGIAGLGLGLASRSRRGDAEDACVDDLCQESFTDDADASQGLALGANISFAIGGAALVTGAVLIAVNAVRARRSGGTRARVVPAGQGLAIRF